MGAGKHANSLRPGYLKLQEIGELSRRIEALWARLESCDICPHQCKINRLEDERGKCKTGRKATVSSFGPHFGGESPLVGRYGSGTIFFTHCNLLCIFCQNYDISHLGHGYEADEEKIAEIMLSLQNMGCHNINFVTPTHVVPQIVKALPFAIGQGLNVPLVYNSGGYDSMSTLELLDGIFDIYMPDLKYSDDKIGQRYCNAKDYAQRAREAIKKMHQQVGDLIIDERGVALKGLLIRHLILPDDLAGTKDSMRFVAGEISRNTYVNLMDQYRPCCKANDHPPLDRGITGEEFSRAVKIAQDLGLERLDGLRSLRLF
ncbi:MAG: radical SAM protein [Candidatus Zixiibacteriota bacterium]|nr:MAG: radical SAM protein [candidate division Zixibacteria bacterium]